MLGYLLGRVGPCLANVGFSVGPWLGNTLRDLFMLGYLFRQCWVICWAMLGNVGPSIGNMLGYLLGHVGPCLGNVALFAGPC